MGHFIVRGLFTQVKSPMNFHGGFYPSGNTLDYKMTHWLFTLLQIISNILTSSLLTFSVIYTFYFYIAFEELTFYQKCLIKCVLYSLFYRKKVVNNANTGSGDFSCFVLCWSHLASVTLSDFSKRRTASQENPHKKNCKANIFWWGTWTTIKIREALSLLPLSSDKMYVISKRIIITCMTNSQDLVQAPQPSF